MTEATGTSLEEMELLSRAREGDAAAFSSIVRRYQDRIYNLSYRYLGNAEDAADAAQETFLAAWEGLGDFRGESALYTWLYSIAVHKALGARRKRSSKKEVPGGDPGGFENARGHAPDPPAAAEAAERERIVQEAITALDEEHRAVVVLKDIEGFEYDRIAEILSVPVGTVKSRLHRGRLRLRELLENYLDTAP